MKEEKELLKVKKKYSIKYILIVKMINVYVVLGLMIILALGISRRGIALLSLFLMIAIVLISLILYKRGAKKTYLLFYEDRVVYKRKWLFININRTLKYSEIKDIVFAYDVGWYAKFFQKRFGYRKCLCIS